MKHDLNINYTAIIDSIDLDEFRKTVLSEQNEERYVEMVILLESIEVDKLPKDEIRYYITMKDNLQQLQYYIEMAKIWDKVDGWEKHTIIDDVKFYKETLDYPIYNFEKK